MRMLTLNEIGSVSGATMLVPMASCSTSSELKSIAEDAHHDSLIEGFFFGTFAGVAGYKLSTILAPGLIAASSLITVLAAGFAGSLAYASAYQGYFEEFGIR